MQTQCCGHRQRDRQGHVERVSRTVDRGVPGQRIAYEGTQVRETREIKGIERRTDREDQQMERRGREEPPRDRRLAPAPWRSPLGPAKAKDSGRPEQRRRYQQQKPTRRFPLSRYGTELDPALRPDEDRNDGTRLAINANAPRRRFARLAGRDFAV